jgi:hypothetical protein
VLAGPDAERYVKRSLTSAVVRWTFVTRFLAPSQATPPSSASSVQGGMATVYLAEDLRHHRQVAIKVLKPELAATLGERVHRETPSWTH